MKKVGELFLKVVEWGTQDNKHFWFFVNLAGILLITIYNLYYCYGTMIFKVGFAEANQDFWRSQFVLIGGYLILINLISLFFFIKNKFKK